MSVIVAKRKQSVIEYVDTARRIADIINDRMQNLLRKVNNKYANIKFIATKVCGYYYEAPIKISMDAYLKVTQANRLYIKNDKTKERRIRLLKLAIEDYNKLASILSVLFKSFGSFFNYNAIKNIIDLINTETKLIQSNIDYVKIKDGSNEKLTTQELSSR